MMLFCRLFNCKLFIVCRCDVFFLLSFLFPACARGSIEHMERDGFRELGVPEDSLAGIVDIEDFAVSPLLRFFKDDVYVLSPEVFLEFFHGIGQV